MEKTYDVLKRALVVLVLFGLCAGIISCRSAATYQTTDINEYLDIDGHIENEGMDIRSGLFIFPESIENPENAQYRYVCQEGLTDNSYMIYLKETYSDSAYQAEKERLANIRCVVEMPNNAVENTVEYTEKLFNYPAYITIYNTNMSFEYALADDENKCIIYIYLKLYEGAELLPEEYLPLEFQGESMMNYDTGWQNQNIYYATEMNGDHVYYLDE